MGGLSPNTQYVRLNTQMELTDDQQSRPSATHTEIQIENDLSHSPSTISSHPWILTLFTGACMFILGALLVGTAYELNLPVSKLISGTFPPASANLALPNVTQIKQTTEQPTQSTKAIHTVESYSEHPYGYWTDGNNNGTHFNGLASDRNRYEPLVDRLIGEQCGGYSGLDYQDFSSLSFLMNQSILMIGDSTDRYLVQYMCGAVECGWRCPKPCDYTRDVLKAQFNHYTYPGIQHDYKVLVGVSTCHIPVLNFTLTQSMTYSILPERYLTHTYFKYNFSEGRRPTDGPYTYTHFINQFVKPFFSPPTDQPGLPSVIPSPTIITAQSGLWDIMLLTNEQKISVQNASVHLRDRWWNELESNMLPAIDEAFPSAKLKYLRTIPPVKDYDNGLCAEISTMMRFKIQSLRQDEPQNTWRLWDIAAMLAECENYLFDDHHYGPNVLNQLFNVLLNDIKARQSFL